MKIPLLPTSSHQGRRMYERPAWFLSRQGRGDRKRGRFFIFGWGRIKKIEPSPFLYGQFTRCRINTCLVCVDGEFIISTGPYTDFCDSLELLDFRCRKTDNGKIKGITAWSKESSAQLRSGKLPGLQEASVFRFPSIMLLLFWTS